MLAQNQRPHRFRHPVFLFNDWPASSAGDETAADFQAQRWRQFAEGSRKIKVYSSQPTYSRKDFALSGTMAQSDFPLAGALC
jgi:hypothetical protein